MTPEQIITLTGFMVILGYVVFKIIEPYLVK